MRFILSLILCVLMVPVALAEVDVGTTLQVQSKSLSLYATPDTTAKVAVNLTQGQNLITVYKQGLWVKVANPQTGDVGWVKESDLEQAASQSGPVVHHYVITQKDTSGKNQQYEVIEFSSNPQVMSQQDMQKFESQMQQQQQQVQNNMNKMMSDMMSNFNDMQKTFWQDFPSVFVVHTNNTAGNLNTVTNTTNTNAPNSVQQNNNK